MRFLTLEDLPRGLFESLCDRLDEGPATFDELAHVTPTMPWFLLCQWLQKQRAAGFVEFVDGRWQGRSSHTSSKDGV